LYLLIDITSLPPRKRFSLTSAGTKIPGQVTTTASFIVTPQGIVGATDNLLIGVTFSDVPAGTSTGAKINVIHGRFILACVGLESLTNTATGVNYYFRDWALAIQDALSSTATFSEFQNKVIDQSQKTFVGLDIENAMKNSEFRRKLEGKDTLAEYMIAGYEGSKPRLVTIRYAFDWPDGKLSPPIIADLSPHEPHPDFAFAVEGINSAVSQIPDQLSSSYRKCVAYAGPITDKFLSMTPLTLAEATLLVRAFMRIEAEADPSEVGHSINLATLPRQGAAKVESYPDFDSAGHR